MKNPLLIFAMALDETPQVNVGRLFLVDWDTGLSDRHRWQCTSGVGSWQGNKDWNKPQGGCIPPTYKLKPNPGFYNVSTKPRYQDLGGIQGNTYEIRPVQLTTLDGANRSEGLIHMSRYSDRTRLASLMCVVIPEPEFRGSAEAFEETFKRECGHLDEVRLLVLYTF